MVNGWEMIGYGVGNVYFTSCGGPEGQKGSDLIVVRQNGIG